MLLSMLLLTATAAASQSETYYQSDLNFRIEPGSKTCVFEKGKAGQMMEVYYQVLDGQHGELDISFVAIDPNSVIIVNDYKKTQNSIIMDLEVDGDYAFCLDNSYSLMNSKLVFLYVLIEDKPIDLGEEVEVVAEDSGEEGAGGEEKEGEGGEEKEVLEWMGTDEEGHAYYMEVSVIAESLRRTLAHVVRARHYMDIYAAAKSRDSYIAFEDTFIVDVWSSCQIALMFVVGMVQVYMIKKLFARPIIGYKSVF